MQSHLAAAGKSTGHTEEGLGDCYCRRREKNLNLNTSRVQERVKEMMYTDTMRGGQLSSNSLEMEVHAGSCGYPHLVSYVTPEHDPLGEVFARLVASVMTLPKRQIQADSD